MPRIIWSIKFWHYHTVSGHWSLRKHTKHLWLYPKGRNFYYFSRSKSANGKSKVKPSNSYICKLCNVYMGLKFKRLQGYHNNLYHLIRWIWNLKSGLFLNSTYKVIYVVMITLQSIWTLIPYKRYITCKYESWKA